MNLTFTIILFFSGVAIITITFIREWYQSKKWGWFKTLLLTGFLALAGAGIYDIATIYLDEVADKAAQDENESIQRQAAALNPEKTAPTTKQASFALLSFFSAVDSENPAIQRVANGDSLKISYELANYGNSTALHIENEAVFGHIRYGKVISYTKPLPGNADTTLSIKPMARLAQAMEASVKYKGFISSTSFVTIRFFYTDSIGTKNKLQRTYYIRQKPLSLQPVTQADELTIEKAVEIIN